MTRTAANQTGRPYAQCGHCDSPAQFAAYRVGDGVDLHRSCGAHLSQCVRRVYASRRLVGNPAVKVRLLT